MQKLILLFFLEFSLFAASQFGDNEQQKPQIGPHDGIGITGSRPSDNAPLDLNAPEETPFDIWQKNLKIQNPAERKQAQEAFLEALLRIESEQRQPGEKAKTKDVIGDTFYTQRSISSKPNAKAPIIQDGSESDPRLMKLRLMRLSPENSRKLANEVSRGGSRPTIPSSHQ